MSLRKSNRLFLAVPLALCSGGIIAITQLPACAGDIAIQNADQQINSERYAYDADSNILRTTDPTGNTRTYQYDARSRIIDKSDSNRFVYDTRGRETDPLIGPGLTTYDNNGNFVDNGVNTPVPNDTNSSGAAADPTDPLGGSMRYHYDANGNGLARQTDPLGNTTLYFYDPNSGGSAIRGADPLGDTTLYRYDGNSNTIQNQDSLSVGGGNGNSTTSSGTLYFLDSSSLKYDANGNVTFTNPGVLNYTFDLSLEDLTTKTFLFQYDSDGPAPSNGIFNYDDLGNPTLGGNLTPGDQYEYKYSLQLNSPDGVAGGIMTALNLSVVPLPAAAPMGAALLGAMAAWSFRRSRCAAAHH